METGKFCSLSDESFFSDFFPEIVPIEEADIPRYHYQSEYCSYDEIQKEKCDTISHKK
jgi:hypothetical protein